MQERELVSATKDKTTIKVKMKISIKKRGDAEIKVLLALEDRNLKSLREYSLK